MSIGVIVGRFQNYKLHEGHEALIKHVANENDKIVFFIGVQDCPANKRHPLNYDQRYRLLNEYLLQQNIFQTIKYAIFPILDRHCDKEWSKSLDNFLNITYPKEQITLYCGRDGFSNHYFGSNELKIFDPEPAIYTCNSVYREKIKPENFLGESFRAGIIYGLYNLHPRVYTTVDIAVTKKENNFNFVLMGTKFEGDLLRFPGGFVNSDEQFEDAARRELYEETSIKAEKVEYIGNFVIDDWRTNTGYKDVFTKTVFFHAPFTEGEAIANDDLYSVGWVNLDLDDVCIHQSHRQLFNELKKFIKAK